MKKYLSLPLLFMAFVAFAQPKIHSITSFTVGKEKQKWVQLFDYQDNGLMVREQSWEYKRVDSMPRLIGEVVQRFSSNKQLIFKNYWQNESKWIRYAGRIENILDNNGCIVNNREISLDTLGKEERVINIAIETDAKCRVLQEKWSRYERIGSLIPVFDSIEVVKKYVYDSQDSLKSIRYNYFYRGQVSNNIPQGKVDYIRRSDGKVIEIYEENNCEICCGSSDYPYRHFYEYDNNNRLIKQKITVGNRFIVHDSTVFSYNAQSKLSRQVVHFSFDRYGKLQSKEIFDYEYDSYCDDLLKSKTTRFEYEDIFSSKYKGISKEIYTYTEGSSCEPKEEANFIIAPNPAFWQATITSASLASADNTLTIFNVAGAIIQSYKINYRTNKFDFSTLDLINGTYLIRLTNDKNSVTKKLVVLH
jgi:hypothetical protein